MPFKSKAQARWAYATDQPFAHRWSDEMRGGKKASKFQREHPIKAANLPDRVDKRLGIRLRKPKTQAPFLRQGVTRMGTVGVEYVHQGTKGWGASETAARAAWEQNRHASRFASGTSVGRNVEKGFTTQSIKPVLARVKPAAGGFAKPSMRNAAKPEPVAKARLAEIGQIARMAPKAAGAGWKAGVKGGKPRMALGTATAMGRSPTLRRIGQAGQLAGEHQGLAGLGTGIVTGSVLGYAAHQNKDVEKSFASDAKLIFRKLPGHFDNPEHGMSGSSPSIRYPHSGKDADAERGRQRMLRRRAGVTALAAGGGAALYAAGKKSGKRSGVGKAHGDPEDSRYYRMGAGSAVLGAGGAAGLGYAAHDARKTTQIARAGSPMGVNAGMRNATLISIPHDEMKRVAGSQKHAVARLVDPKAVHRADRLARHGVAITRRGALAGAGGLAALAGAETLRRQAHERRYN